MNLMPLNFPYYYGHSGEQYAFFRIPKLLLTDDRFAEISTDAKLLYGLLLDRMELSYRNGWIDEQNKKQRPFVKQAEGLLWYFATKRHLSAKSLKK